MQFFAQAAAFTVGLAAFTTAAGVLARARPVRWAIQRLVADPIEHWVDKKVTDAVEPLLDPIRAELSFNGGESLKDKVVAIERHLRERP